MFRGMRDRFALKTITRLELQKKDFEYGEDEGCTLEKDGFKRYIERCEREMEQSYNISVDECDFCHHSAIVPS
ncbi:MAG: CRISPR-associated endonuclease Cas1 [Clostridiales bacterium]|jgi:hypothetical protein|nr:CRISPR-associated endonuclease Cas1 [Clostridiales bacterium]